MMIRRRIGACLWGVLLFLQTGALCAQTESINEGSIEEQFEFVIDKSSNWTDPQGRVYEVIRRQMLNTLKSHAADTVSAVRRDLLRAQGNIVNQQQQIDTLQSRLKRTQKELDKIESEKNSMVFVGKQWSKTGYIGLLWAIITALVARLAFFIFQFKNSNAVTQAAKSRLQDVEHEFQEYRKETLIKEQKIKRKLQDEINKRLDKS